MKDKKQKHAIRVASFEVLKVDGEWKETVMRWHKISRDMQRVANFWVREWLVYHTKKQSPEKLQKWLDTREAEGQKAAGTCPVDAFPADFNSAVGKKLGKAFPHINARCISYMVRKVAETLKKKKATHSNLPIHSAILLGFEAAPQFTHSQPIPFDKKRITLDAETMTVSILAWRMDDPKKQASPSIRDTIHIKHTGKRAQSQTAIFKRLASGEIIGAGVWLEYSKNRRKWFVKLGYQLPSEVVKGLDASKTATLFAHTDYPLQLKLPRQRRRFRPLGNGPFIAPIRERITKQRKSRSSGYRYSSARKGHGRVRNDQWRCRLQDTWRNFTTRVTNQAAASIVQTLIDNGVGELVYFQPKGDFAQTRFLATEGKSDDVRDGTSWPFERLKTRLSDICHHRGIQFSAVVVE